MGIAHNSSMCFQMQLRPVLLLQFPCSNLPSAMYSSCASLTTRFAQLQMWQHVDSTTHMCCTEHFPCVACTVFATSHAQLHSVAVKTLGVQTDILLGTAEAHSAQEGAVSGVRCLSKSSSKLHSCISIVCMQVCSSGSSNSINQQLSTLSHARYKSCILGAPRK